MSDFEAPSFSLGLDFDLDSEPQIPTREPPPQKPAPNSSSNASFQSLEDEGDDFGVQVVDSDPDLGPEPPRILKRLRRGPTAESSSVKKKELIELFSNGDDEIQEFSLQEDLRGDEHPSTQYHSMCSSSKIPLHGHGVLTTQSSNQRKARKMKEPSDAPASINLEKNRYESIFPSLTISPLRRFQLIDSDSDDPSIGEDISTEANKIDISSKEKPSSHGQNATASEQNRKASVSMPQNDGLRMDFGFHIPTPALDEICEEYFLSEEDRNIGEKLGSHVSSNKGCHQNRNSSIDAEQHSDLADPHPPAHNYFFHGNMGIQNLVRSRLPNFFPLGLVNNRENKQPSASVIDYMSQFSNGEASNQRTTQKRNVEKSTTRSRKKSEKLNADEILHASGSWVNPKSTASVLKDAGKRRVHADGRSDGRWYTAPNGKKVYVNRSGQELTGQIAYRRHRKESGAGFRKSKKKTSAKKRKR